MNPKFKRVAVIDYNAGNLGSIANALELLQQDFIISSDAETIRKADAVVFPGVGAANDCMQKLKQNKLVSAIEYIVTRKIPMLAICIGLQLLFTDTEENGWHECLNIIPGHVKRLPQRLKVPHIGWNQVKQIRQHPFFKGIPDYSNFYFVHSYYVEPVDTSVVLTTTDYGIEFCSAITKDNILATQFHPEKSGPIGLSLISNFLLNV